jgi:hypothetical protein
MLLLAGVCVAHAKAPIEPGAGVVRITAQARVGDTELADAKMEFSCTTGKGGALQVAVVLPEPESVSGFPLIEFEGPDGIGGSRELATWSMLGPKAMTVTSTIHGWRGVDGDGFLLASSRMSNKESDLARLVKRYVGDGGQQLWLKVAPPEKGATLEVRALPGERRAMLAAKMAPCLTQVKPRP